MANTILKELREFRTENNKRWDDNDRCWEENNRRWEENDRRWEENNKRWEENDRRWEENNKRWKENDRRWEENNKRWEENDRRWEENNKCWEENNKRWNENNKCWKENQQLWKQNNSRWEENTKTLAGMDERIAALEEGRKKDRKDLIEILDVMQKTIDNQFTEMREYFDAKFEKVFVSQRVNDMEHEEFKKLVCVHEKRLDFYNARISWLEKWKDQFDMGEYTAV